MERRILIGFKFYEKHFRIRPDCYVLLDVIYFKLWLTKPKWNSPCIEPYRLVVNSRLFSINPAKPPPMDWNKV